MALDVWYKSDIQNALSAAEQASGAALTATGNRNDPFVAGYRAGYRAALATMALAFGLAAPHSWPHPWTEGSRRNLAAREAETSIQPGPSSRSPVPALSRTDQDGAAQVQVERDAHDKAWEEA